MSKQDEQMLYERQEEKIRSQSDAFIQFLIFGDGGDALSAILLYSLFVVDIKSLPIKIRFPICSVFITMIENIGDLW